MFECRRKKKFKLAVKISEPQELQLPFVKERENNAGPRRRELFRGGHHCDKRIKKGKKVQDIIF